MKHQYIKTNDPSWVKDPMDLSVINIDNVAYQQFLQERERIHRVERLEKQVNSISADIGEIRQLLLQIVNGK